tara:strand:- start:282 stop:458 length:177 start_codon:yes stop_codon:yes gene_type:complete
MNTISYKDKIHSVDAWIEEYKFNKRFTDHLDKDSFRTGSARSGKTLSLHNKLKGLGNA